MDVQIDDYGRIVIPKSVRDRLGLEPGASLEISLVSEGGDRGSITLTPKGQASSLQQKGSLLVHTGKLADETFDIVEHLRKERTSRSQKHAGRE